MTVATAKTIGSRMHTYNAGVKHIGYTPTTDRHSSGPWEYYLTQITRKSYAGTDAYGLYRATYVRMAR